MERLPSIGRLLVAASTLLCLSLPGLARQEQPAEEAAPARSPAAGIVIETLRLLRSPEPLPEEELLEALEPAATGELPLLFEILETRVVPTHDEEPAQALSEVQEGLLLRTLAGLPPAAVRGQVDVALAASDSAATRRASIQFLGATGDSNDLPRLFELAQGGAPEEELDRGTRAALRGAVASLLGRDELAFFTLSSLHPTLDTECLRQALFAIGDLRDPAGLVFVSEMLQWHPELLMETIAQVSLIGSGPREELNEELRARLRGLLDADRPRSCRAAALALASLEDLQAVPALIELLGAEQEGMVATAHGALIRLTGLQLSRARSTWARWYELEQEWMQIERGKAFQHLRGQDPGLAARAIQSILPHPLAHDEFVKVLLEQVASRDETIRVLSCETLARLQATEAVPLLVRSLQDPYPSVTSAAVAALRDLTGLSLSEDPKTCRAELAQHGIERTDGA